MFKMIKCNEKPVLTEPSLKQREMINAYQMDVFDREWPQLGRLQSIKLQRITIPPQRPNTPVELEASASNRCTIE